VQTRSVFKIENMCPKTVAIAKVLLLNLDSAH